MLPLLVWCLVVVQREQLVDKPEVIRAATRKSPQLVKNRDYNSYLLWPGKPWKILVVSRKVALQKLTSSGSQVAPTAFES